MFKNRPVLLARRLKEYYNKDRQKMTKGDRIMEELFNIIAGVCSIIGLLVSLFTASKVIKINSEVINKNTGNTFQGGYVGGNSINETGSGKQK